MAGFGKRKADTNLASIAVSKKKMTGHWSSGLASSMQDPDLKVEEDELCVTIKDKYPKAKFHFLVLPKESIASLNDLQKQHIHLLKHMDGRGRHVAEIMNASAKFRFGYHAVPSMSQIHLHVISQDFDSPALKTKKHWNSFTTDYFIDSTDLVKTLEDEGHVRYDTFVYSQLLKKDLRCHVCKKAMSTMPALKEHIRSHFSSPDC